MRLDRQHSPIKYCGSGVYKIKRFAAYQSLEEDEEQREYAVNPFTSGARFIQSMRNQRASGKGWADSFKIARNRNAIAAAEKEARVARDAVSANSRGLEVAQSNRATLKPKAETSGDIASVNAYNHNEKTIKALTKEQPGLNQQLDNKLKDVENLRSNKDLGSGVKDVNVTAKRRAAQEEVGRQLQAEEEAAARAAKAQQEAAKAQKPWDERRAAQENVGKQLQAEEEAAKRAQQEAAKAQQQAPKPTNPEPQTQQTQIQQPTPTANPETPATTNETPDKKGWFDGLSGWGKAGVIGGATAGVGGLTALGYAAGKNSGREDKQ